MRKCCGGDDRDAGKFRRYSFDFTIVNVQSGIETGMDITKKNWLLKKVSFLLCIRNVRERWGMESFMIVSHNNQKKIAVINDFQALDDARLQFHCQSYQQ